MRSRLKQLNIPENPPNNDIKASSAIGGGSRDRRQLPQDEMEEANSSLGQLLRVFQDVLVLSKRLWYREANSKSTSTRHLVILVILNVALLAVNTGMSLWFSYVIRAFTTALQEKKEQVFWNSLWQVMMVISLCVPLDAAKQFCSESLSQILRQEFTVALFQDYLSSRSYFHIKNVPNAGVRAIEVDSWVSSSLSIVMTFLQHIMNLVAFSGLMMYLSTRLFGALFIYSSAGTIFMAWLFFPSLTELNARMADEVQTLRHSLVRIHEYRESIAFMQGGSFELKYVTSQFSKLMDLASTALKWSIGLSSFQEVFEYATIVLPYLVVAPLYFSGEVEYGVVSQSSMAFYRVKKAMNVIISQFTTLSSLAATTRRINSLMDGLDRCKIKHLDLTERHKEDLFDCKNDGPALAVENLEVRAPYPKANTDDSASSDHQGALLCCGLTFNLPSGQALLIKGRSGCGKSSLLRVFSKLWPACRGRVLIQRKNPNGQDMRVAFLPQSAYFPRGTLREALVYPLDTQKQEHAPEETAHLLRCLKDAQLGDIAIRFGGLDLQKRVWSDVLSHGEQQRLSFARVFFQRPDICFADEATSAIDAHSESALYQRLRDIVPTVISVGHRVSLDKHHEWSLQPDESSPAAWKFDPIKV